MAVESNYTGDGNDKTFDITFPFIDTTDVKVSLAGVTKALDTDYTISDSVLTFTTAPGNAVAINIYRNTDITSAQAIYQAGASVKAADLNNNQNQALYKLEEVGTVTASDSGLGLVAGSKGDIHVNTATDWYIRDGVIENSMLANFTLNGSKLATDCITADKIANDQIDSEHYVAGSIDNEHLANNSVSADKIQDASITVSKLSSAAQAGLLNPIGTVIWFAGSTAPTGYLKCNGDTIPDGSGTVQSITHDFSDLYNVVGSTLPDLRGEFIRGWDNGRGVDSGRNIRTTQSDMQEQHNHDASISGTATSNQASLTGSVGGVSESYGQGGTTSGVFSGPSGSTTINGTPSQHSDTGTGKGFSIDASHTHTVSSSGLSVSTSNYGGGETRPRNVSLLACIKY